MENINVLMANIEKQQIDEIPFYCCDKHQIHIDLAINRDDMLRKAKEKRYNGVMFGNKPKGARFTGFAMIRFVRQVKGYEEIPAVIITQEYGEIMDDVFDTTFKVLIVSMHELKKEKVKEIMHDHFLQFNQ